MVRAMRLGPPYDALVIASQRVRANARPDDWRREAIHLSACCGMDCFVASLLAMTAPLEHDPEKCAAVFRKDHAQTKS
jgi:hypothetical protein